MRSRSLRIGLITIGLISGMWLLFSSSYSSIMLPTNLRPKAPAGSPNSCIPGLDEEQFVAVIDAGSQGSRIHLYRFNNCRGNAAHLEREYFYQIKPGLSAYADDPLKAAQSLDKLLEKALADLPKKYYNRVPLVVKATAGLRNVGVERSEAILKQVKERLKLYPFVILDEKSVEVMDGADEGVYAWITLNYLLGLIGDAAKHETAAIIDLGGGSSQIVFEPILKPPEKVDIYDHLYNLSFAGHDYKLYEHSHLNYGMVEVRKQIYKHLLEGAIEKAEISSTSVEFAVKKIENPCFASGSKQTVEMQHPKINSENLISVIFEGPEKPDAPACRKLTDLVLKKDAHCPKQPCSFNGVYQPSITDTFERKPIWVCSFFYDRISKLGLGSEFSLSSLKSTTEQLCFGQDSHGRSFTKVPAAMSEELIASPEMCLDLNYMLAFLMDGLQLSLTRNLHIAKEIDNFEIGWALGASLAVKSQYERSDLSFSES